MPKVGYVQTEMHKEKVRNSLIGKKRTPEQRAYISMRQRKCAGTTEIDRYLLKRYGISEAKYNEIYEKQGGVCAVCKKQETAKYKETVKRLAVDHDHDSGTVRGLLCFKCNTSLGNLNEDVALLSRMIDYIQGRTI